MPGKMSSATAARVVEAIVLGNAGFQGQDCVKMLCTGLQEVNGHYPSAASALNRDLILV